MFKLKVVKIKALLPCRRDSSSFRYHKLGSRSASGSNSNSGDGSSGSSNSSFPLGKLKSVLKLTPFACMMPVSSEGHGQHRRHHQADKKNKNKNKKNKNKIICCSSFDDGLSSLHLPKGSCAVYVGPEHKRFVLKTCYLTHPALLQLLHKSEEEFGFDYDGGLLIPCPVAAFESLVQLLKKNAATPEATRQILEPIASCCC